MTEYNSAVTPLSIVDAAVPLLGHCHCVLGYLVSPTLVPTHYTDILEARTPPPPHSPFPNILRQVGLSLIENH